MFSGVQFYTGQLFDIPAITAAAHRTGALAVWDLAHAAGSVDLKLHAWNVDGACWCSYKYLNSGPGGIGGFFIHERHFNKDVDRLSGWWSHRVDTRFQMTNIYEPCYGANEFRLSNVPILSSAALLASLDVYSKTSMHELRCKSLLLTELLVYLLDDLRSRLNPAYSFQVITGRLRGAQLSLLFDSDSKANSINRLLEKRGVMVDYRKPGLVRAAPAPLYCSFTDVFEFRDRLAAAVQELEQGLSH
jgi:kynureninase